MRQDENELLSRVGPGTKLGEYMRQFWVPVMLGARLEPDGPPERVRLLGENFVVYRATDGRLGFLDENCPHRGVSMALARNADCALQCIFHGWKIDVTGKLIDVPAEPPETREKFIARVKIGYYPVREAAGIVFAWLGKGEPAPFPSFNWLDLPANHFRVNIGIVGSSWYNGMEGQLDSAHVGILHQDWVNRDPKRFGASNIDNTTFDLAPRFEFEEQPYGYREAAIRNMPDGRHYVRVREYVMPWYSYIPQQGGREAMQLMTISVPIDDETSAQWDVRYNLARPMDNSNWPHTPEPEDTRKTMGTIENRFGQDYNKVKAGKWAGFPQLRHEDYAVSIAQGVIADRVKEQLSSSDLAIVRARRALIDAVNRHAAGEKAVAYNTEIDWKLIRSFAEIIPAQAAWQDLPRG